MYGVYLNADMTEGRGPMVLKFIFPNKTDADRVANELEPYGNKNQFNEVKDLDSVTYANYADWKENNDATVRAKALAKLTPREKQVLGIK